MTKIRKQYSYNAYGGGIFKIEEDIVHDMELGGTTQNM